MKIQDVIDEVNEVWGEEHEEKRKKIFRDSVLINPLLKFIGVTLIYLSGIIMYLIMSALPGSNVDTEIIQGWGYIFNIPYFLFDIRVSMIISLASVLLSLYVSVGKFADGSEGPSGDARRAVYRKFAVLVSRFIFVVFVLNFWHGLFSGYFQGSAYAPEILGPWKYGPGWGRLIIPLEMNLGRYGEIPLWILLFFAWFTLSSASLLTFNEKDILIRNFHIFRRINYIYNNKSLSPEYRLAQNLVINSQKSGSHSYRLSYKYSGSDGYDGRLAYDSNYSGFKFRVKFSAYMRDVRVVSILCLWMVAIILFAVCSVAYTGSLKGIFAALFIYIPISAFEIFNCISDRVYLHKDIFRVATGGMAKRERVWEWVKSFLLDGLAKFIGRVISAIFAIVGFWFLLSKALREGNPGSLLQSRDFVYVVCILLFTVIVYILFFFLRALMRLIYNAEIDRYSAKYASSYLLNGCDVGSVKYLIVAYIYCSIIRINGCYSDYQSEIGKSETMDFSDKVISYQSSRLISRRIPYSLRRK